ncbi:MAG: Signal transduction histidine kinase [Candidatus Lokiarchaeum sp. GC14_75]|nr:MAG: Signal transduction histidine kinase [Candidatus Lokiarchaeum sp. GC14_75]
MLDESFLNLQITFLLTLGTIIFILVSFRRRDLIAYLPPYLILPIGYLFIYLQIYDTTYRLLGNLLFLIGALAFIIAIYYDYFKTVKKIHRTTTSNPNINKIILSLSPITSLIIGIQIIFSILIFIAIIMIIKLYRMERSAKHATIIVFLISALFAAVSTVLSYFPLPGMWELSYVATIILSAIYFILPIIIFLEEKLAKSKIKVKESEEKYRLISENANDLIAILNDKYEYEYINEQAYLRFLGYSNDQLIGKNVWELVHPEDVERIVSSQQLSTDGFQDVDGEDKEELRIKHKNGTYIWMEYTSKVFVSSEGTPKVIVITRDITDRKKAVEVLKESEEKYHSLFENSPIALMDQDFSEIKRYFKHLKASGINDFKKYFDDKPDEVIRCMSKVKLVDVNRKALEVYKFNNKEDFIIKMNQLREGKGNIMTEEVFLDNKMEMLSLINGDTMYESEIVTKTSTGETISIYAKTSIVPGFESTWSKVIVSIIDITARKLAEQRLKESEEKFRTITEQSFIGVIIEQDFMLKYINHQFSIILGYTSEELFNWRISDFYEIIHLDDVDRFKKLIDDMTKGTFANITNFQFRLFKKTGEVIWLELFSRKIMYKSGSANLIFIMDITEKRESEQLILEENKKLVELDNLRGELITRISHELRTPLTSMYAASQILLGSNQEDSIRKIMPYIEISHRGSTRLRELVENLLDTSRIENRKFELKYSNVNINTIINDCVKELNYLADNRQITLNVNLTMDVYFKLDKYRFPQVVSNILSNAIKNTPPKGMVFLTLNETDDYIDIIIKDTGVGLVQEEKNKLFQKFGKIERYGMGLDVDIEGAGLGLYISKEIVELHGGQIIVESEGKNKGSTFIIHLNKIIDKFQ